MGNLNTSGAAHPDLAAGTMEVSEADKLKAVVGERIALRVQSGQTIGIGTGSTVDKAIDAIARRIEKEGLSVNVVPSSYDSAIRLGEKGLKVLDPRTVSRVDWYVDGADEVLRGPLCCIKGNGAAHTNEKILAKKAGEFVVIVDGSKMVERLGSKFPIPIEVLPSTKHLVIKDLLDLGASEVTLRPSKGGKHGAVVTENNGLVLDARFDFIDPGLEVQIKAITGVIESGLFVRNRPSEVIVAHSLSDIEVLRAS
ncbi:MAG: ribose-5-phosphate isomerase RpiA [Deltaproteobacteria bacterium]|nr:ribose-5-phosphate isomerase RpiA [Deltaproteobacteria bacterium]